MKSIWPSQQGAWTAAITVKTYLECQIPSVEMQPTSHILESSSQNTARYQGGMTGCGGLDHSSYVSPTPLA